MTADVAAAPPDFDLRDVIDGAALLASTAISRFPFNACLQDLRLRMMRDRLTQLGLTVTPRSVRVKNERVRARAG
jgi:hypothetical protein